MRELRHRMQPSHSARRSAPDHDRAVFQQVAASAGRTARAARRRTSGRRSRTLRGRARSRRARCAAPDSRARRPRRRATRTDARTSRGRDTSSPRRMPRSSGFQPGSGVIAERRGFARALRAAHCASDGLGVSGIEANRRRQREPDAARGTDRGERSRSTSTSVGMPSGASKLVAQQLRERTRAHALERRRNQPRADVAVAVDGARRRERPRPGHASHELANVDEPAAHGGARSSANRRARACARADGAT